MTQGGYPGIGRATTCLVEALLRHTTTHQYLLLYDTGRALPERLLAALAPPHRLLASASPLRSVTDQITTPLRLRRARADLFHSPYYAQALRPGCPTVLTLYDLIPVFYPRYWPAAQGATIRWWMRRAAMGARRLIAPSQVTARDIARVYRVADGRVTVAPLAADVGWLGVDDAPDNGAPSMPYLLCVCTNKPHKNLSRLVEAHGMLLRELRAAPDLVIAGGWDDRYPEPEEAVARTNERAGGQRVRFVHGPDDATLRSLYRHALGFVFPSEYEGFGLPVLEAMTMGLPVAASSTPAVAEVAGDACLRFDPLDTADMARCMARLAGDADLRDRLRSAGPARARLFSWDDTAARVLDVYRQVLGE